MVRQAKVFVHGVLAGRLIEENEGCVFCYASDYQGPAVSLTLPISSREYRTPRLPSFFEGLLPEGEMLEGLLRLKKLDRKDVFGQLLATGEDPVGAVTVIEDAS